MHQRTSAAQSPNTERPARPPLYKEAILTFIGIYPLIMAFMGLFGPAIQKLPLWLNNLIVCLVLVPLLTFVIMPLLHKLFGKWLK